MIDLAHLTLVTQLYNLEGLTHFEHGFQCFCTERRHDLSHISDMLSRCPDLETLVLRNLDVSRIGTLGPRRLPSLKKLSLSGVSERMSQILPSESDSLGYPLEASSVNSLAAGYVGSWDPGFVNLSECWNLVELKIDNIWARLPHRMEKFLEAVASRCPHLLHLDISGVNAFIKLPSGSRRVVSSVV